MAVTSIEERRGRSDKANGISSEVILDVAITMQNLAAELAKFNADPYNVNAGTVAYNPQQALGTTGAIYAFYGVDGKWYYNNNGTLTEVT
jgi:hypothetical protein